ncbi:dihydrolipoyllysine-residue acetyltransferase [Thalassolituus sp. LLYu03]|uniref:dihydrolipoyllysine-residue acetyltransferase n=1 Tax=Thalassolituus sp. LLYu03 TaxID=3421656 RepID=UPI003D287CC1
MSQLIIPDLGGASQVDVIEILVAEGDHVDAEQAVLVLETDKASMEIPAGKAGVISRLMVKVGDKVSSGDAFAEIKGAAAGTAGKTAEKPADKAPAAVSAAASAPSNETQPLKAAAAKAQAFMVPDIGGGKAEVIELSVQPGDAVQAGDTLLVLESDKASMEIPAEASGVVQSWSLKVGDKVQAGDAMLVLMAAASSGGAAGHAVDDAAGKSATSAAAQAAKATAEEPAKAAAPVSASVSPAAATNHTANGVNSGEVHAGPAVRKLARELGVDLALVAGSGRRARITKEDVQNWVKSRLQNAPTAGNSMGNAVVGSGIPPVPVIDFSQFGDTETVALNNIKRATARAMTTAWLNVPQVTQFDLADITDLEAYRVAQNQKFSKQGIKFSLVPFVLKALSWAMKQYPAFNASLSPDGQSLILKKYVNIGVAVDTPKGLLVPVIRDVDRKSVTEITQELAQKAGLARDGKLSLADMQGGCLSLSSLGGIGGTAFTPIVSPPEVAILGLSKASMQPVWNGETFIPRLMLPLSLSYDHRVIDGAEAARFAQTLVGALQDMRETLM